MSERAMTTIDVRVDDLKPGDVIDAANYRNPRPSGSIRSGRPRWAEVVEVVPSKESRAEDRRFVMVRRDGEVRKANMGYSYSRYDLVTIQRRVFQ